jgi:ferrous iron transport protein A
MGQYEMLSNLKEGEEGKVEKFTNDRMASKFLSMGVLPGKNLRLIRRVPFGGGLYIKVENQNIAVREEEARNIVLEMTDKDDIVIHTYLE